MSATQTEPSGATSSPSGPFEAGGEGRQRGAVQAELLHPVVAGVGDVDRVGGDRDAHRLGELAGAGALGADRARTPVAGLYVWIRLLRVSATQTTPLASTSALEGSSTCRRRRRSPPYDCTTGVADRSPANFSIRPPRVSTAQTRAVRSDGQALGPGERGRLGAAGAHLVDVGAVGLEALDPVVEPVHDVDLAVRGDVHGVRPRRSRGPGARRPRWSGGSCRRGRRPRCRHPRSRRRRSCRAGSMATRRRWLNLPVSAGGSAHGCGWLAQRPPIGGSHTGLRAGDVVAHDPAVAGVGDVGGVAVGGEDDVVGVVHLVVAVAVGAPSPSTKTGVRCPVQTPSAPTLKTLIWCSSYAVTHSLPSGPRVDVARAGGIAEARSPVGRLPLEVAGGVPRLDLVLAGGGDQEHVVLGVPGHADRGVEVRRRPALAALPPTGRRRCW